ncbi:hypothetical protein SAMN04488498_104187 [Mesorhizobium albiziae]|uniref:Uncharacterized protein n=1 Tax=Neomesorhizobium albiziae TaxID=335020 RepID=A0A1I3Y3V0_9HYPH|nr:hypothetical protein SAMN04488498_104187 [Mesorhizobium albiziae]
MRSQPACMAASWESRSSRMRKSWAPMRHRVSMRRSAGPCGATMRPAGWMRQESHPHHCRQKHGPRRAHRPCAVRHAGSGKKPGNPSAAAVIRPGLRSARRRRATGCGSRRPAAPRACGPPTSGHRLRCCGTPYRPRAPRRAARTAPRRHCPDRVSAPSPRRRLPRRKAQSRRSAAGCGAPRSPA